MSATTDLIAANVRSHARRYVATGIAVAISMAFVLVSLSLTSALTTVLSRSITAQYQGAAALVGVDRTIESDEPLVLSDLRPEIEKTPGVGAIAPMSFNFYEFHKDSQRSQRRVSAVLPDPFFRPTLREGELPTTNSQVAIDAQLAETLNLAVGDTVDVRSAYSSDRYQQVTVTGVVTSPLSAMPTSYATESAISAVVGEGSPFGYLVALDAQEGAATPEQQEALVAALNKALPEHPALDISTGDHAREEALNSAKLDAATTQAIIMVFPVIAMAVALIVVSTTFQVVLHQRKRELALLRTLGARSSQVRRIIIAETLVVGLVASLVAVLVGAGLTAVGLWATGLASSFLDAIGMISTANVGITLALGTLLTLLVGVRPALGVARISPMAALSPIDEAAAVSSRASWVKFILGGLLTVGAGAGMYMGVLADSESTRFGLLLGASVVGLVGFLVFISPLMPALTRSFGLMGRSIVGTMARENTTRNPGRTAATGVAIVIGVTLVSTMLVGASSLRATLDGEVDARRPLDLTVQVREGELPSSVRSAVPGIAGVEASVEGLASMGVVVESSMPEAQRAGAVRLGIVGQPDLNVVSHSPITLLDDDKVLLQDTFGVDAGTAMTVCVGDELQSCGEFTAVLSETTPYAAVISEKSLLELAPDAVVDRVHVKLAEGADATQVQSDLATLDETLLVEGAALERQMYTRMINIALGMVVALLGVSVLVSLVGVTNTLSLSVRERTRENGLLRALGLSRRQMRRMLAWEAVFIAVTATLIGLVLGVFFGWIGMLALPVQVETLVIEVPWLQLAGVVLVSVLSAVVAAWLPGRRAARTSPVVALADQ
ncbi:ABC transporter permease [Schaalia sp. Marseille-Q2122]|uniref:ABC transporter permease n=1 Tax=Schaalia sp. Marseille-Q2122 TaxID=2736604 RepID=UPI001588A90C|nr:FtsX-like permease family protein [Schaalia sp. Marseille-Q2122]